MIDRPTIAKIMDATKIEEVVSEFVTLKKRGINYVGLCPFHNDSASIMSACVLFITIPIHLSPYLQQEVSVIALPVEREAMQSTF